MKNNELPNIHLAEPKLSHIQIVYCRPVAKGWSTLHHMVHLAGEMFSAPVHTINQGGSNLQQLLFPLLPRCSFASKPDLLVIAARPRQLLWLSNFPSWRSGFNRSVAWIIDSFWTDNLPAFSLRGKFERLYVVTGNDAAEYQDRTGIETRFLGIGTDALRIAHIAPQKDIDLFRIGRQPKVWTSDAENASAFAAVGLRYQGRTPYMDNYSDDLRSNATYYARAKFVMAHSNLVDDSTYTHDSKEYITERWTDALSSGAAVVGKAPLSDWAVPAQLWPGALLDVSAVSQAAGIEQIRSLVSSWKPEDSRRHRQLALDRLDWRHRFAEIATYLGHAPPVLLSDLESLRAASSALASA